MFTQIFDTHSHYTDSAFDEDRDQVLDALPKEGIVHAVLAGTTLEDSAAGIALTRRYDYLYAAGDRRAAAGRLSGAAGAHGGRPQSGCRGRDRAGLSL